MATYGVAEAKNGLPALIDQALSGEEVVISRRGKPVVEIRARAEIAEPSAEELRRMNEWIILRRSARPAVSIDSVELMNLVYEDYAN